MSEATVDKNDIDERLQIVFHQLLDLYERQTQERQIMIKEKEEFARLTQLLVSQTKEIGQYENGIRKRIQDCIRDSAEIAMKNIEKLVVEKDSQTLNLLSHKINDNIALTENMINNFRSEKLHSIWKIVWVTFTSSIITSVVIWIFINSYN